MDKKPYFQSTSDGFLNFPKKAFNFMEFLCFYYEEKIL